MIAWLGWVLFGLVVYYNAECALGALGRAFTAIGKELIRILNA